MELKPGTMRHDDLPMQINALTERVIGLAIEVHRVLGPGLLEKLYEDAIAYEFERAGIAYERQVVVRVGYKDTVLSTLRLDLVVEGTLVLELKCVDRLPDWEAPQLVSQLRSADFPVGLIINFHKQLLRDGITRRVNPHSTTLRRLSPRSSACSETSAFTSEPRP